MHQTNKNNRNFTKELTPEEKFELMVIKWRKESEDRLKDIKKGKNRKRPDTRYCLSPYRFLEGN